MCSSDLVNSSANRYIKELKINGNISDRNYLTRQELFEGATLDFVMSDIPDKKRGTSPASRPYSFSLDKRLK